MWLIPTTHPTTVPHSNRITIVAKPLGSHSHRRNNPSLEKFYGEIFRQPLLRHVDTPPRLSEPKLPFGAKIFGIRFLTRLHVQAHALSLSLTRQRVRAIDRFSGRRTSPPESPAANLLAYIPGFTIQHLHLHFFLCFVFGSYTFLGFLDFSDTQRHLQGFGSCCAPSSPMFHPSYLL